MKVTALVILLGIGLLAWYYYPDAPAELKPAAIPELLTTPEAERAAPVGPAPTSTSGAGTEQHFVFDNETCREVRDSGKWPLLRRAYPGLSDAELCDYLLAPHVSKLQGVEVNSEAVSELLDQLMAEGSENPAYIEVPDLRYYLDPQSVAAMHGLSRQQLLDKVNNERSAEAAFWLGSHYHHDEPMHTTLMLIAASYAKKPGPLINALNGCCSWTPGDAAGERAAKVRHEALSMIAKELGLPEAGQWPDLAPDAEITADVLELRAAYVEQINQFSMDAHGEEWLK